MIKTNIIKQLTFLTLLLLITDQDINLKKYFRYNKLLDQCVIYHELSAYLTTVLCV